MAEKKPTIVIKKITVAHGGHHGGSWKVAFADFMTAMMAFFLVMWLISGADDETKDAISDYFSTPSVIDYQFSNFGAELVLEKIFLDLFTRPLQVARDFVNPIEKNPNILNLGTERMAMAYLAENLGEMAAATDVRIQSNEVYLEIPDSYLFQRGTSDAVGTLPAAIEKIKGITIGLDHAELILTSKIYVESVPNADAIFARQIADERIELIGTQIGRELKTTVHLKTQTQVLNDDRAPEQRAESGGSLVIEFRPILGETQIRPLRKSVFGGRRDQESVYESFVQQAKERRNEEEKRSRK